MRQLPAGLGLAFLALAVAATAPVAGCRGESPVRVVRSESSGVGTSEDEQVPVAIPVPEVPAELREAFHPNVQYQFDRVLNKSVSDLERPIQANENRFGTSRLSFRMRLGDHLIKIYPSKAALIGNKTSPLSPDTWSTKLFMGMGGKKAAIQEEQTIFSDYAKEAYPFFAAGYREPIRWRTEIGVLEARPVIHRYDHCLTFHTKNKKGDVAGILIARMTPEEVQMALDAKIPIRGNEPPPSRETSLWPSMLRRRESASRPRGAEASQVESRLKQLGAAYP